MGNLDALHSAESSQETYEEKADFLNLLVGLGLGDDPDDPDSLKNLLGGKDVPEIDISLIEERFKILKGDYQRLFENMEGVQQALKRLQEVGSEEHGWLKESFLDEPENALSTLDNFLKNKERNEAVVAGKRQRKNLAAGMGGGN